MYFKCFKCFITDCPQIQIAEIKKKIIKILVAHLTVKVVVLKTLGCALLQLSHSGGLLQFLRENLVQFNPAPLDDLPLDLR